MTGMPYSYMMGCSFGLEMLNIILLAMLISVYLKNLSKVRSNLTMGLLIFAGFLLVQNLLALYLGAGGAGYMCGSSENYMFAVSATETIALLALFWVTWK